MNFRSNFSFGVAGQLLKGLKYPRAKQDTSRLLSAFLDIDIKTAASTNILGYLAALLPVEGELPIVRETLALSGGKNLHQYFFTEQLLPDVKHGALLFIFLVTILQNTEKEHEQIFIYEALRHGIKFMPEAFSVVEETLAPMMSEVVQKSQNLVVLGCVHSIMESMFSFKQSSKLTRTYLNEIGYHKLPECARFDIEPELKREVTKIVILLLDNLLKDVHDKK